MITFDEGNLNDHDVTTEEVEEVLHSANLTTRVFDLDPALNGNDRVMFVGFTMTARLLEIGVELRGESQHVFHAMDATKPYRKEFSK